MELDLSPEQILDSWGDHFATWVGQHGYTNVVKCLGYTFIEFLSNIDDLHMHLKICFDSFQAPSFRCVNVSGSAFAARPSFPQRSGYFARALSTRRAIRPSRPQSSLPHNSATTQQTGIERRPRRSRPSRRSCTTHRAGRGCGRSSPVLRSPHRPPLPLLPPHARSARTPPPRAPPSRAHARRRCGGAAAGTRPGIVLGMAREYFALAVTVEPATPAR